MKASLAIILGLLSFTIMAAATSEAWRPTYRITVGCGAETIKVNGQPYSVSAFKEGGVYSGAQFSVRSHSNDNPNPIPGLKWKVNGWQQTGPTRNDDSGVSYTPFKALVELSADVEFQYDASAPSKTALFETSCTQVVVDYHHHP